MNSWQASRRLEPEARRGAGRPILRDENLKQAPAGACFFAVAVGLHGALLAEGGHGDGGLKAEQCHVETAVAPAGAKADDARFQYGHL